jgi:hypothetical protein
MASYAKLENNVVVNVVVADQEWIDTQIGTWCLVDENLHPSHRPNMGATYDSFNNVFVQPQPYPSWVLDENRIWRAPITRPDGPAIWDEEQKQWIELPQI